ncbi:MAG: 30S ribosomal protein S7, partial [Clostridia bacterium]|nr:30S ribosomal protein S7 [Clostridia bacterium]
MSRRNAAVKREVLPDPLYNSTLVTKIVNQVMLDGKKGIAQSIVYTAMKTASEK